MKKKLLAGLAVGLVMFAMAGAASAATSDYYSLTLKDFSITTRGNGGTAPTISSADNGYTYAGVYTVLDHENYYDDKSGVPSENLSVSTSQASASYTNGILKAIVTPTTGYSYSYANSYSSTWGDFIVTGKGFVDIMANYTYSVPSSDTTSSGIVSAGLNINDSEANQVGNVCFEYYSNWQSKPNGSGTLYMSYLTNSDRSTLNLSAYTSVQANSHTTPTPVPGAVWLFGSGLAGLVGLRKRKIA